MFSRRRLFVAITSAVLAASVLAAPARAATPDDARALVKALESEAVAMAAKELTLAQREARFRVLLANHFDVPAISRFILSRHWNTATPEQRQEFQKLFEDMTVLTWVRRFDDYGGQTLDVTKISAEPDGFLTETAIARRDAPPMPVLWRMAERDGRLRVTDITVEGVSMAITQRQEYGSVIQRQGGIDGLLQLMRSKIAKLQTGNG